MSIEVKVPVLGESISEATIGEWLKKPGDAVAADEAIASLETDKVAVEVPAPSAGVMGQQMYAAGDTVQVGALLAMIEAAGSAAAASPPATPAPAPAAALPLPRRCKGRSCACPVGQLGRACEPVACGAPSGARTWA